MNDEIQPNDFRNSVSNKERFIRSCCCGRSIDVKGVQLALQVTVSLLTLLFCMTSILLYQRACNEQYFSMISSIVSFWLGSYSNSKRGEGPLLV